MSTTEPSDFARVHPVSPFIRGGIVVLAVLGYLVTQQVDRIATSFSEVPDDGAGGAGDYPLVQLGAVALAVLGAVLLGLLSWWFTRYRLGADTLEMHTGAIFRQHREVRYDRIQAVDLVRPLLARLCGLSEVRVESAGGGDSHVAIAYLRHADAEAVRSRLLGLAEEASAPAAVGVADAVGAAAGVEAPSAAPPARHVLTVPSERIIASVLLSWDSILLGILLVTAVALASLDLAPVIGGLLPVVVVNGLRALGRLTRWYGLTIGRRGETLTSQRGLTDTRTSSVPLHRVQALAIRQPVLWRRAGWWSLTVNVAGAQVGSASDSDSDSVLVPVATTREVLDLLEVVTADTGTTREVASLVDGTPEGFVGQPRAARWLHPFAHRRIGYLPGTRAVVTRSGWADRRLEVVPWGRIQSLTLHQGPVARRLGLASLAFVSTVGPVRPEVAHLAEADAELLGHLAAARSSTARRRSSGPVGCDPAPEGVDWPMMSDQRATGRTTVVTGESTEQGEDLVRGAVAKLGFEQGQIVQEYGWDDDSDDALRAAIEDVVGDPLEDEDYTGIVDAVIMWWHDDDGDLTDALVDTLGTLAEGSSIVLLTPRPGQEGEVDPSEVDEAATTAGLHTSGNVMCSDHWVATRLAARKGVA